MIASKPLFFCDLAEHPRIKRPNIKLLRFVRKALRGLKNRLLALFDEKACRRLALTKAMRPKTVSMQSIKVVSCFRYKNGVASGADLQIAAFRALGYEVEAVDVTQTILNPFISRVCTPGGLFIFHVNGDDFIRAAWPLRKMLTTGKIIGYFVSELPVPPRWPVRDDVLDEIWTPSRFSADALQLWSKLPVRVVPHVYLRDQDIALPERSRSPLTFLTMADMRSSFERKNPLGAIKAFQMAFQNGEDVVLRVKLHATWDSEPLRDLKAMIAADPRIDLIDRFLSPEEMIALYRTSHVFISLHRAEGFGLPLLEAQTHGLVCVATGWSGNLDFMDERDSMLIDFDLQKSSGDLYEGATWAEPDLGKAATSLHTLFEDSSRLNMMSRSVAEMNNYKNQLSRFLKSSMHLITESKSNSSL